MKFEFFKDIFENNVKVWEEGVVVEVLVIFEVKLVCFLYDRLRDLEGMF